MKKFIATILVMSAMLGFAGCGNNAADKKNDDVLRVGMECNYAPYNWSQSSSSGNAIAIANVDNMYTNGYDVQVAAKIAESLGKKLEIHAYEWDGLIPGVQSGKLDMIIAGMSPSAERREKIDFSDNYYTSNLVIVTKKDKLIDVKSIADLKDKKIAAQSGTVHLNVLADQTQAQVSELSDFTTMLIALDAGTIDGYVAEEPTALSVCRDDSYTYIPLENNKTGFKVEADDVGIAVGVKKGSALTEDINKALKDFDTDAQKKLMVEMAEASPSEQ